MDTMRGWIDDARALNEGLSQLGMLLLCCAPQRAPRGARDGEWYIRECCGWHLACRVDDACEVLMGAFREQGDAAAFIEAVS